MGLVLVPIEQRRSCQLQVNSNCCTISALVNHAPMNEIAQLQASVAGSCIHRTLNQLLYNSNIVAVLSFLGMLHSSLWYLSMFLAIMQGTNEPSSHDCADVLLLVLRCMDFRIEPSLQYPHWNQGSH